MRNAMFHDIKAYQTRYEQEQQRSQVMFKWTVYIVTDTGRHMPHWSDTTRDRARAYLRGMGKLPAGVRGYVAKTDTVKGWAY